MLKKILKYFWYFLLLILSYFYFFPLYIFPSIPDDYFMLERDLENNKYLELLALDVGQDNFIDYVWYISALEQLSKENLTNINLIDTNNETYGISFMVSLDSILRENYFQDLASQEIQENYLRYISSIVNVFNSIDSDVLDILTPIWILERHLSWWEWIQYNTFSVIDEVLMILSNHPLQKNQVIRAYKNEYHLALEMLNQEFDKEKNNFSVIQKIQRFFMYSQRETIHNIEYAYYAYIEYYIQGKSIFRDSMMSGVQLMYYKYINWWEIYRYQLLGWNLTLNGRNLLWRFFHRVFTSPIWEYSSQIKPFFEKYENYYLDN